MTTTSKVLAGVGAAAVIAGILIFSTSTCHPYRICGGQYARADGSVRPESGSPVGHFCGQVGSDHSTCYVMDFGEGRMEIFITSGALGSDGYPIYIAPAPIVDAQVEGHPGQMVCDKYRNGNGPRAKPCPSGRTLAQYSADIEHSPWWSRPTSCCGTTPTPANTTPPPSLTVTPTPIAGANPYADYIEQLAKDGITSGCGAGIFCPGEPLTREQAAVWFVHEKHGSTYVPPPCVGMFDDVPCATAPVPQPGH